MRLISIDSKAQNNLAMPVMIQIQTPVSWVIYSWAAIQAHQAIFIPSKFALCAKYSHIVAGMQIHIRPVARGDKNYVRAIVNQHVTSPAGDWFPVRSEDHVWLNLRITAERRTACSGVVVVARYRALLRLTRGCV